MRLIVKKNDVVIPSVTRSYHGHLITHFINEVTFTDHDAMTIDILGGDDEEAFDVLLP